MPRRMAFYDYTDPVIAAAGRLGDDVGGRRRDPGGFGRAVPRRAGAWDRRAPRYGAGRLSLQRRRASAAHLPAALNGFGLWLGLMVGLTVVNYGFPIAHLLATPGAAVPVVPVRAVK